MIEAVIDTYRDERAAGERFIDTVRRVGARAVQGARPTPCDAAPRWRTPPESHCRSKPMKFIDPRKDRWHALGGEDGPPPASIPTRICCSTLEQWHAHRAHWPAGMPVGCVLANDADVEAVAADLRAARAGRAATSRTGSTAVPTARRACCARAIASRARCAPPARCWSTCCRCSQRTGFDAVVLRADQSIEAARARARLLPRPLPGRCSRPVAAVRQAARHGRRARARAGAGIRERRARRYERSADRAVRARDRQASTAASRKRARAAATRRGRTPRAASCRPPAWAPKTWCSPT